MSNLFLNGHAVVVGIGGTDLPITIEDAKAMANTFTDVGRCAYPPDQVKLLTGPEAHRNAVLDALDNLATRAASDSTSVIYFSGHGIDKPDYYLLTHGYDLENLNNTCISGEEFTQKIRNIKSKKLLVLLDCCHAGGQAQAKGPPLAKSPLPLSSSSIQELGLSQGRVVIASSRKDEKSWTGIPYSQFTNALLEGLAGYGAFERDGFARVLDISMYVGRMVPNRTLDKQHPIMKISNLQENFPIAFYSGGETSPKSLNWTTALPPQVNIADGKQIKTWWQILLNRREALLLMEERSSEYIEYQDVPLQLIMNQRKTQSEILDLEHKLGIAYGDE